MGVIPVGALSRVALSLPAVLAGWFAAAVLTLPFPAWELLRNAAPHERVATLAEGSGVWLGFTLLLAGVVWLVLVIPIALLVPARFLIRHRLWLGCGGSMLAVWLITRRLGTWSAFFNPELENPLLSSMLQMYLVFILIFAFSTAFAYSRLLRGSRRPRS